MPHPRRSGRRRWSAPFLILSDHICAAFWRGWGGRGTACAIGHRGWGLAHRSSSSPRPLWPRRQQLVGITLLVFLLLALSPGGIGAGLRVSGGQMEASKAALMEAYLEDRYGLDDPIVVLVFLLGRINLPCWL